MRHIATILILLLLGAPCGAQAPDSPAQVEEMTTAAFKEKVWNYSTEKEWKYAGDRPAIIDLYASWCGPCRVLAPILDEIQKDLGAQLQVYKVNVDKERELSQLFQARAIPLMIFVPENGTPVRVEGLYRKDDLLKIIDEYLLAKQPTSN
jgi:thioredoxin